MAEEQKPATPATAATPGEGPAGSQSNQTTPPAPSTQPGQGDNEGKVTIPLDEYRNLQRNDARYKSFERRNALKVNAGVGQKPNSEGADPDLIEELNKTAARANEAERRALQAEVKVGLRDLLEKDEFKNIPKSTKDLIMKNPATLSDAETYEEAMLDVEDFLREQVVGLTPPPASGEQPKGHETPSTPGASKTETPTAPNLEDPSKLTGAAKSQAMIRNAIKLGKATTS